MVSTLVPTKLHTETNANAAAPNRYGSIIPIVGRVPIAVTEIGVHIAYHLHKTLWLVRLFLMIYIFYDFCKMHNYCQHIHKYSYLILLIK